MPEFNWLFLKRDDVQHLDDNSVVIEGVLALRAVAADGVTFDRDGTFLEGVAVLPTKTAEAVTELFAFREFSTKRVDDEEIYYQISNDGGTTWQWWNGGAWAVVTLAADRNIATEIDQNLPGFPLKGREFAVKVFLVPSTDAKARPLLSGLVLYAEFEMNYVEDVSRSLKRFVLANVIPKRRALFDVAALDHVLFPTIPPLVSGSIKVYNLTTDRYRETDLFLSLVPEVQGTPPTDETFQRVNFTSAQTGRIEVQYSFTPFVYVAMADAAIIEAQLPSIVLQSTDDRDAPLEFDGTLVYDVSVARYVARERHAPLQIETELNILLQGDLKQDVLAMDEALRKTFRRADRFFPSIGSGHDYTVVKFAGTAVTDLEKEDVKKRTSVLTLSGKRWDLDYTELPLTQEITLQMGTFSASDAEVSI